jgi:hypothetical protein
MLGLTNDRIEERINERVRNNLRNLRVAITLRGMIAKKTGKLFLTHPLGCFYFFAYETSSRQAKLILGLAPRVGDSILPTSAHYFFSARRCPEARVIPALEVKSSRWINC